MAGLGGRPRVTVGKQTSGNQTSGKRTHATANLASGESGIRRISHPVNLASQ
jgi:hypothetical protein